MSAKLKYGVLALMLASTAALSLTHYNIVMMGLTTFVLAYLSKGMRRCNPPDVDSISNDR